MAGKIRRDRATLGEVALRAGVSTSTVSLVLAGKATERRIGAETRDRVQAAAEELNYAPNLLTRSLRRGRTHVISFFSSFRQREWGDLYLDRLTSAVETAGGKYGYDVLIHCNYNRSQREVYESLNGGMADGLLMFAPEDNDPLLAMLRGSRLPIVLVNHPDEKGQYPSAGDDVEAGIDMVANALLAEGHTRIAAFGSRPDTRRDSEMRLRLLASSLKKRGAHLQPENVFRADYDIKTSLTSLLSQPNRPTALFCWHDRLAYEVLEACDELGVQVPEQLSIIGYDGIHWPSTSRHICTSIEVDIAAIASEAVRLLDVSIADPGAAVTHRLVPVSAWPGTTLGAPAELAKVQL